MPLTDAQKRRIEDEERLKHIASSVQQSQKHGFPALLSFFLPGLGQIVKGQVGKGILIFIAFVIGFLCLVLPGVIIWIWQVADAYNN